MESPFRIKNLKEFLVITLIGIVISLLICPQCYWSIDNFTSNWETIFLCLLYTYILGYGSTFIISLLKDRYSWLEHPKKKFFLHFSSLAVFSFVVSAILFYVFAYTMLDGGKWLTISEVMHQAKLPALISISIAGFFTGTDFLTNWKNEAIRAERLEKEKMATQYESLRNQVNPHFLFNSLNALSELVYENQELAVTYIRHLSQVYRYVLDSRNLEVASLRDERNFLEAFIFLQKIRFGDNLIVNIDLEENDSVYILPLSLQILLENAIKHNVVSEEDPLRIDIFRKENHLVMRNAVKLKKSLDKGTGIGLENIQMRYKYLTEIPVNIYNKPNEFIVEIPILTELP